MTAPTLSLPFREYEIEPDFADRVAHVQWSVERLVEFWAESGEDWPLGMIRHLHPDWTLDRLRDDASELCHLSMDVAEQRESHSGRWKQYEALRDEYHNELAALATRSVSS